MDISTVIDRKQAIRQATQPAQAVKQRLAEAAQEISRTGDLALHVEIANEALCKFCSILYQKDIDGQWANIDQRTARLLVPAPWGNAGWKRWGLRNWEAVVLRAVLMGRLTSPRHVPLFDYNEAMRTWHLNVTNYPNLDRCQNYLQHCAISLAEWRQYTTQYRNGKATVAQRYRDGKATLERR